MQGIKTKISRDYIDSIEKVCDNEVSTLSYKADRDQIFCEKQLKAIGESGGMKAFLSPDAGDGLYQYAFTISKAAAVCGSTAISYHVHMMVMRCIAMCANEALKDKILGPMSNGDCIGAFALTEPHAGSDSAAIRTVAGRHKDEFVLNGEKKYIMNITGAGVAVVVAKQDSADGRDLIVIAVPLPSEGVTITPIEMTGERGSGTGSIVFKDCRVSADNVLGEPGKGHLVLRTILNFDRLGAGLLALSTAQAALDIIVDYTSQRQQFGKPVSAFQSVQFDVAEIAAAIRLSEVFITRFLEEMTEGKESGYDASVIKLTAAEMAADVTMRAIQLLGAAGYETAGKVERMHREVLSLRIGGGTSQIQKQIIAKSVYGKKG